MKRAFRVIALALVLASCTPGAKELQRWQDDAEDGPERLAAVVASPKTPTPLARDAALALLHVVRRGRHVGIELFGDALATAPNRDALVGALAPALAERIRAHRSDEDRDAYVDKDGAVAILARSLAKGEAKSTLEDAIAEWLEKAGWDHVDAPAQRYALDATAAVVGPAGARVFRNLLGAGEGRRHRFTMIIVATGDDETKAEARKTLTKTAYFVAERGWRASMRERVEASNTKSGLRPTLDQLDAQLRLWQTTQLKDLYDAILLARATEATGALLDAAFPRSRLREVEPEERVPDEARIAAIDAVRALSPKSVAESVDRFIGDATAVDRPDGDPVGIAALTAVAASPEASDRVTALLDDKRPNLRRDAAIAIIKGTPTRIPEILVRLPSRGISPFDARLIGQALVGAEHRGIALGRRHDRSLAVQMVTLVATATDPDTLARTSDATPLPLDLRTPCLIHDVSPETLGDFVKKCATTPTTRTPIDPDAAEDVLRMLRRTPKRR